MLKKIFTIFIFTLFCCTQAHAMCCDKISETIKEADLEKNSTVSISVKQTDNGKKVYEKNSVKLLNPASSLKLITFAAALNELKEDYLFKTSLYKEGNTIYIKLGADPLLSLDDLKSLIKEGREKGIFKNFNKIFIDDTVIDKTPYVRGTTFDDVWFDTPKLSPYTLDKNTVKVRILISKITGGIEIAQDNPYKFSFINELQIGESENIKLEKVWGENTDIINVKGTILKDCTFTVPVNNPKFYFIANLKNIFESEKISYRNPFYFKQTPKHLKEIAYVAHNMNDIAGEMLLRSDNFTSDILLKIAGGEYKSKLYATDEDGIDMVYNYYKTLGLNIDDITIADGSGVSRYNLVTTDWITDALIQLKDTPLKNYMAQPGQGTLARRLRHLKDKVRAKTGTLCGVSALSGYINAKNGNDYVFSIIIQNHNKKVSAIKSLEDDLIDEIYEF